MGSQPFALRPLPHKAAGPLREIHSTHTTARKATKGGPMLPVPKGVECAAWAISLRLETRASQMIMVPARRVHAFAGRILNRNLLLGHRFAGAGPHSSIIRRPRPLLQTKNEASLRRAGFTRAIPERSWPISARPRSGSSATMTRFPSAAPVGALVWIFPGSCLLSLLSFDPARASK
jgi:hypothetical protein